jgi:AraC family transcriptional regulator
MSASSTPVFDQLARTHARLEARLEAGRGRGAAIWTHDVDRVSYEDTALHTVSLYLDHGEESRRLDRGAIRGHAGALCLMPQGSRSDWAIGGRFRFVHLYLDDARLRHFAAETLGRDPARVALPDLTYYEEPGLAAAMRGLARVCAAGDAFAAEAVIAEICHRLLTTPIHGGLADRPVRGGLSPAVSRRVIAMMAERLDRPPSLDELAAEAGLSPFHFQRMFRASHGLPPHAHLEAMRIDEAKRLMRAGDGLAEVASACGWCHQSAFTRSFRAATGLTPGAWRRAAGLAVAEVSRTARDA